MAIDDNIIGEWLFTEASGTNVANTVGTSDLTLTTGGVGTWTTSGTGDGINFSTLTHGGGIGIDDLSVNATDISDGLGTGPTGMGFALVVSGLEGTTNGERVFHIGSDSATGDSFLTVYSTDRFNDAGFGKETTDALGVSFRYRTTTVSPSDATVIVFSVDTTQGTEANRLQLYINGALEGESARYQDASSTLPDFKTAGHNLYVMNRGSLDRGTKGSVYAVALFNAPIPAAQAGLIYDQWVLDNNTSLVPTSGAAPAISNISSNTPTGNAATITWTTDIPATSQVDYGITTGYGGTESDATLRTSHSVALSGLTSEALYNFKVSSVANAQTTESANQTFTTADITSPAISNISSGAPGSTTATVTWTTDELASSRVNYGLTTGYGSTEFDATLRTSHSVAIAGLTDDTLYHFEVESIDASANTSTSTDQTFTTAASFEEATLGITLVEAPPAPAPVLTNPAEAPTGDGATLTIDSTSDLGTLYSYSKTTAFTGTDEENAAEIIANGVGQSPVIGENTRVVTGQDSLTPHYAGWVQDT